MSRGVLMITPFCKPNIGGAETYLDSLCNYLSSRSYRIFVVSYQPLTTRVKGKRLERKDYIEIHRVPWIGGNLFPKLMPYPILEFLYLTPALLIYSFFFMLTHSKDVDVIHAHGLNAALIGKLLKKLFSKRCVFSLHAIYELDRRPILARMVRWISTSLDTIFALAERSKEDLEAGGLPKGKIKIAPQWVNLDVFKQLDRSVCRRELGLEGKFVVLFVGRLIEPKGVTLLLEIASKIEAEDIVFLFVGDGPLATKVKMEASVKKNILFAGKVSEDKLVEYYNAADVFVLLSQYEEGFARVVLETLACGTPIIASNRGCLPEMVDSSVGILINPTIDEARNTILLLYKNPDYLNKLRENCRRYSEEHFTDRNAKIIEEAYSDQ
ncbi:MAG: glycosyltransferase family 4 protein [Candidatus Bathyarchaeia archaeon]